MLDRLFHARSRADGPNPGVSLSPPGASNLGFPSRSRGYRRCADFGLASGSGTYADAPAPGTAGSTRKPGSFPPIAATVAGRNAAAHHAIRKPKQESGHRTAGAGCSESARIMLFPRLLRIAARPPRDRSRKSCFACSAGAGDRARRARAGGSDGPRTDAPGRRRSRARGPGEAWVCRRGRKGLTWRYPLEPAQRSSSTRCALGDQHEDVDRPFRARPGAGAGGGRGGCGQSHQKRLPAPSGNSSGDS